MAMQTSYLAAAAQLDALKVLPNAGGAGFARFISGTMPGTCEAADAGTVLLTINFNTTAFGATSDANPGAQCSADLTGGLSGVASAGTDTLVDYVRVYNNSGTCIWQDNDVGTTGSGANIQLSDTTITSGDTYDLTSWTLIQPES